MMTHRKKSSFDYIIIIMGLAIICLLLYIIFFRKNEYKKMEDTLVSSARNYVSKNNITTNKEIYLNSSKIGVTLNSNCSIISGVIYDGSNYFPYLSCNEYKSSVISENVDAKDFITLKGDEVVVIAKGMDYYDYGYTSNDIITRIGEIGTEEGVYNLFYKPNNSNRVAIRKVIVVDDNRIRDLYPTIVLNGENQIYVIINNSYQDMGVQASDNVDGNITNKVVIENSVNTSIVGEYNVNYMVTNSRGYTNMITRKVNVINKDSNLIVNYSINPNKLTNEDVTIQLKLSDDYDRIVYPDGTAGKSLDYVVSKNDTYKFSIFDKYGREIIKEITIDNIDKTVPQGTCTAELYFDRTEVKVNITTSRDISGFEYIIDDESSGFSQANSYVSKKYKPTKVTVKIKDSINKQNELSCNIVNKFERKIVTDSKGKNCLEGLTCYVQYDYGNSSKYPYCSMSNKPNTCGGIGRNGCSITSTTNAIAAMGVKSKTGVIHNPYTVWDELYPINKNNGQCNGGCSAWSRIRDAIIASGLSATRKVDYINQANKTVIIEHLKKGWPIVVWADTGAFTSGRHYMSLLGVREDGYVFLSDSANESGINKSYYKGRQYYVDTWIPYDDLISGEVKEFLLVGPAGVYEGK